MTTGTDVMGAALVLPLDLLSLWAVGRGARAAIRRRELQLEARGSSRWQHARPYGSIRVATETGEEALRQVVDRSAGRSLTRREPRRREEAPGVGEARLWRVRRGPPQAAAAVDARTSRPTCLAPRRCMAGCELSTEQLQQLYLCSLLLGRKREQPIFSCKAHVFHIDPKTKRSWISASNAAVSVSFFYDSTRSLYRIISVEGTKAVINSTITPNMSFTKTSQKFGQWSDVRANTVYGLGFSSEAELNKFIEKFQEVKDATRLAASKAMANGTSSGVTPVTSANASPITSRATVPPPRTDQVQGDGPLLEPPPSQANTTNPVTPAPANNSVGQQQANQVGEAKSAGHQRTQSLPGLQQPGESPKHQTKSGDKSPAPASAANTAVANLTPGSAEAQLKYENDRLKLALAQSSANAKKWEVELTTLKNSNVRLTSALQESTANVEEWKRQLHSYKEENQRIKTKYIELEAAKGSADAAAELRKELQTLRQRVETLEMELKTKDDDIKRLSKQQIPEQNRGQDERIKSLQQENAELQAAVSLAQAQLETALAAQESQRRVLDTLNIQLATQLSELAGIHREIATALQT